jgi:hypothetical protein
MKYLPLIFILASCVQKSDISPQSLIYQPEFLIIEKGTVVNTVDGIFISPARQVWYSQKKIMELEKQLSQF